MDDECMEYLNFQLELEHQESEEFENQYKPYIWKDYEQFNVDNW